eukprot:scaffold2275_cov311-Prasinococcus_capsulatus_cf.AAC.1
MASPAPTHAPRARTLARGTREACSPLHPIPPMPPTGSAPQEFRGRQPLLQVLQALPVRALQVVVQLRRYLWTCRATPSPRARAMGRRAHLQDHHGLVVPGVAMLKWEGVALPRRLEDHQPAARNALRRDVASA